MGVLCGADKGMQPVVGAHGRHGAIALHSTKELVHSKVGVGDHASGLLLAQHRGRRRVRAVASAGVHTARGRLIAIC